MPDICRTLAPGGALGTVVIQIEMLITICLLAPYGVYSGWINSAQDPMSSKRIELIICKSDSKSLSEMTERKY